MDRNIDERFRDAAAQIYQRDGFSIPVFGAVWRMADGSAFVEAVVEVKRADLDALEGQQQKGGERANV
jgi:hypothetical protein